MPQTGNEQPGQDLTAYIHSGGFFIHNQMVGLDVFAQLLFISHVMRETDLCC